MVISAWVVGFIHYSAGIIDWTIQNTKRMDVRPQKLMMVNDALH